MDLQELWICGNEVGILPLGPGVMSRTLCVLVWLQCPTKRSCNSTPISVRSVPVGKPARKKQCGDFMWGLMELITLFPATSLSTRTFTASLTDKGCLDWQPALPSPTRMDSQVPEAAGENYPSSCHSKLD